MSQIRFFTEEQEASISQLQAKWKSIALSTARIDRDRATESLKEVYSVMGKPEPEVIFCDSPRAALEQLETYISQVEIPQANVSQSFQERNSFKYFATIIWSNFKLSQKRKKSSLISIHNLVKKLTNKPNKLFKQYINNHLPKNLTLQQIIEQSYWGALPLFDTLAQRQATIGEPELSKTLKALASENIEENSQQLSSVLKKYFSPIKLWFYRKLMKRLLENIITSRIIGIESLTTKQIFYSQLSLERKKFLAENPPIITSELAINCILLDFYFSVLNYPHQLQKWQALQNLVQNCGLIFGVDNTCIICDRPTKILIDEDRQLHGEGEPALEYSDGYVAYVYHGFPLPEGYGAIHPSQWQPEWVLLEQNRQLKKVLIQGIGVARLCQELSLIEVEKAGEYTLFKLDENTGTQATYFLQRIDPETKEIKAVSVSWTSRNLAIAIEYAHDNYSAEDFPLPN